MPEDTSNGHPKKFANRYRVDSRIGEGAHASTWRGWDERLERPVAIKMLHQKLASDPVFVQRFQAEAKVAASVRQSNVVDVYDFGQEDGTLYIIMQFIDGEDLKQRIQRTAPIAVKEARRIIGNVLDGLHAIHNAGIVHRDIKPQNILIGTDGIARVTDFGVAEVDDTSGLTSQGFTIGTVDYMAPEQAQGLPLTPSADLYATGVMLYEMLTGTLPFQGKTSRETMLQHINGQLTPPGTRMPQRGITPALDAVIGQSLAKDPARRFGSARAMKQAVGQALSGTPVRGATQATSVIPTQQQHAPARLQSAYQPASISPDEGAGLKGAFRGILLLLMIGAIGVAVWGAYELMGSERFDFNLPSFGGQEQETPAPTATSESQEFVPIEPTDPEPEEPVVEAPVEQAPTQMPTDQPEPTSPPVVETEPPPIEPIEPDGDPDDTEAPEIEPSGYDDGYLNL